MHVIGSKVILSPEGEGIIRGVELNRAYTVKSRSRGLQDEKIQLGDGPDPERWYSGGWFVTVEEEQPRLSEAELNMIGSIMEQVAIFMNELKRSFTQGEVKEFGSILTWCGDSIVFAAFRARKQQKGASYTHAHFAREVLDEAKRQEREFPAQLPWERYAELELWFKDIVDTQIQAILENA